MPQDDRPRKRGGAAVFFTLLILVGTAGAVFWFGWVQFSLEEGQTGLIYTKTHGYDDKPVSNGEFIWRWEALLPTNLTLNIFDTRPRVARITKTGTLPSGDVYSALAGQDADFDWGVTVQVNYRLALNDLPALVDSGYSVENQDSWFNNYESQLESVLLDDMNQILVNDGNEDPVSVPGNSFRNDIQSLNPFVDVLDVDILELTLPDRVLYERARSLYLETIAQTEAAKRETEILINRRKELQEYRLKELEQYGALFDKNPSLLQIELERSPEESLLPKDLDVPNGSDTLNIQNVQDVQELP